MSPDFDRPTAASGLQAETVAEGFLMQLRLRGIRNFFVNAGTDFAPLLEAYARLDGAGDVLPRPVVAGHESVVMGMAHGAFLLSGEPQAVMFHVNVGTANAICATLNAAAERVPLLVCAGRTPLYEGGSLGSRNTRVAWGQEMYDQAGMIREAVKWDYELRGAVQLDAVVDRALTIANTAPRGPVYLTLPREVLAEPAITTPAATSAAALPSSPHPDPAAVARLADELVRARLPVISAMASGADPASVPRLAELCDQYGIGYVEEQPRYLNLPSSHPLHLGQSLGPVFREADALCFVEADVPWIPESGVTPRANTFVAQCGEDPNFQRYPIRTHRSDLSITSGSALLFAALGEALDARRDQIDPQRRDRIAALAAANRSAVADALHAELARTGPITNAFATAALAPLIHDRCTVFNEYPLVRSWLDLNAPASYFYLPAPGGLGWALPCALGAKMQAPERTMIVAIGDGTYMFSNPAACHHASEKHGLPVLTIIFNNARWNAVDSTAKMVYPSGHLSRRASHELSDLRPSPAYEQYVMASGGHGVRVAERDQLAGALKTALDVVEREGRQAVVNVLCS